MLAQTARSVASCMVILEHNRRNGRHFSPFPLLAPLSHWRFRGFESAGKRQVTPLGTQNTTPVEDSCITCLHMGDWGLVLWVLDQIVRNRVW